MFQDKAMPHQGVNPGVVSLYMVGYVRGGQLTLQALVCHQA